MGARALAAGLALLVLAAPAAAASPLADLLQALQLSNAAGRTPPPLALERLGDGRTVALRDLRGRAVLLYFWATW